MGTSSTGAQKRNNGFANIFLSFGIAALFVVCSIVLESYSPGFSFAVLILGQLFLWFVTWVVSGTSFNGAVEFAAISICTLPFLLRSAYHALHAEAFDLGGTPDTISNWFLYVGEELFGTLLAGIPRVYDITFTPIKYTGHYGPTLIAFMRVVVVTQFFSVLRRHRQIKQEAWDQQIEADALAGRLDALGERADQEFEAGRCRPL